MSVASSAEPLALAEVLDLRAARPLAHALLARRGEDLEVDASGVARLGGLCLQVLISAAATWVADGRSLQVVNPSDAFRDGATLMGAGRVLGT